MFAHGAQQAAEDYANVSPNNKQLEDVYERLCKSRRQYQCSRPACSLFKVKAKAMATK